jgi:acyl-CoA thioester hydrolase
MFEYTHLVQFYETDLMGIVHHSNYIRFYEEARVAFAGHHGLLKTEDPSSASAFAVTGANVRYLRPSKFGDRLRIQTQAKLVGGRIFFEYKMWRDQELVSEGRTEHVNLDQNLRPQRPSVEVKNVLKGAPWNETWLLSL